MIRGFFSAYRGVSWFLRGLRSGNRVISGVGALVATTAWLRSRKANNRTVLTEVLKPGESVTLRVVRGETISERTISS
ncbi:MAG: hypothetical protein GXP36_08485 [Actinobacteria bacterium]|nr:hypothetical protein [Actinomycetota bacterium]